MSEPSDHSRFGQLVLARLLVAGEKGATAGDLKKAFEPLAGHRWSGSALTERIDEALADLATAGLVARTRKGKTERATLTAEGKPRALEAVGLNELPPKTTWDKVKKTHLAARALGLAAPDARAAQSLGTDNGFKAALLTARFELPLDDYPSFDQAVDAFVLQLLGLPPAPKFNIKAVKAALIRRALGDHDHRGADSKPDPKNEATKLLAQQVGARRAGKDEIRLATLRRWVDGEPAAPAPVPVPVPPPSPPPLDLPSFARRVVAAARSSPTGRFGDNKVFIAHVWRALHAEPAFAALGLDGFKRLLAEANNARHLDLGRADLVEAMDPEDVKLSEVLYLGATFHFVRI